MEKEIIGFILIGFVIGFLVGWFGAIYLKKKGII